MCHKMHEKAEKSFVKLHYAICQVTNQVIEKDTKEKTKAYQLLISIYFDFFCTKNILFRKSAKNAQIFLKTRLTKSSLWYMIITTK